MAKLSSVNKNERRKQLVKKYAGKYAKLKAIANDQSPESARLARLMKRLFAPTALAIELEPAQPGQPPDGAEQS